MDVSKAKCPNCDRGMSVARVECADCDVAMEGSFDISPLARLSAADQLFVTVFLRVHGSLKAMEKVFGISYPTVKNRLASISSQLPRVQGLDAESSSKSDPELLDKLESGDLSVSEVLDRLRNR
ncbi:MAG: DUF2089 domain-containing protein [Gammaproteobacteria bacterium]|nr:DUF2089 domain-containing protein [Gammaproteobacteria bacterium]